MNYFNVLMGVATSITRVLTARRKRRGLFDTITVQQNDQNVCFFTHKYLLRTFPTVSVPIHLQSIERALIATTPPQILLKMYAKVVICLALCVLSSVSAGVIPVAAPLAAAGVIAPYATSYNAHTVNHNIAAPYVSAAPIVAAPAAYTAAVPTAYAAAPAIAAYSAPYTYPYLF